MKVSIKLLSIMFFATKTLLICAQNAPPVPSMKLWYRQPANALVKDETDRWKDDVEWLKALPLGNGALGAMVFGDVHQERVQLNEKSMWSGSPNDDNNPEAYPAQAIIRKLLFEGKYKEATELTQQTQICKGLGTGHGSGANVPFGCFQTLGDLWIDFQNQSSYENYYRELDMEDAVVRVTYTQNGVHYKREIFISHPNQALIIKLTADKPSMISFKSSMTRPEKFQLTTEEDNLIMYGTLTDGKGGNGLQYMTRLTAINKNGTLRYTDSNLIVENADEVILLLTASTNYSLDYPSYKGKDYRTITKTNLQKGKQTSYKNMLSRHKKEYQQYFKRVELKLSTDPLDTIPTDERLIQYKQHKSDLHLVELLFQYGRYLLIASSRPETLPANLQGMWANKIQTPWNGDYHTDINVQMNYWLAETTNLSEMHLPLFDFINSLQKPGSITANIHYNLDGWVLHPIANVWGFTAPGENAGWGMHVSGGAWLATHIMEHYYFTMDKNFLKQNYPILKQATLFYKNWLLPHPQTNELISGPSVSPENSFMAPDGSVSKISMGPAHDHQVIWHLFKNFIDASQALGIKDAFLRDVIEVQKKIAKPKIGKDGRLMEWYEEFKEIKLGHRHVSHLFALYPGYQIDIYNTPALAVAAKKSLDCRVENGGGHTGWSAAWLINLYARLGIAESAERSLNTVLEKSTTTNLFGLHPPFQMDANFGTTAGIAEMLLQSHANEMRILPALPKSWSQGEFKGLCARGGFVVDVKWLNGKLNYLKIFSKQGGKCVIEYQGKTLSFITEKEKTYFPLTKKKSTWKDKEPNVSDQ